MKLRTIQTMKKNILKWYEQATPEEIQEGNRWYSSAREFSEEITEGHGENMCWRFCQVISIMSPQVDWETNKKNAKRIWECYLTEKQDVLGLKMFATELQKVNALNTLKGDYEIPQTALKTFNFANNIFSPDQHQFCTIDRHAVKVAMNDKKAGGVSLTAKNYREVKEAYEKAARSISWDLTPCQLQAIVWVTYKRVVNR
jgi:hypothetical protein